MKAIFTPIILICSTLSLLFSQSMESPCQTCEELRDLKLPDVTITGTESVSKDARHCKVMGIISKEIKFEILLPESWNERFVMSGGGGFSGFVENGASYLTNEGYVTAGTNTGHEGHPLKADWALNNMERQVNFGHLAVHRTAEVSKFIINAYYCKFPAYNYFIGCSRGGGQAMIEAQRYPEDFDGIVAIAPILDWPATGAEFIQNSRALYTDEYRLDNPIISKDHVEALAAEVLKQCDQLDGVDDGILNDPRVCEVDFSALPMCADVPSEEICFTLEQIKAIRTVYEGTSNKDGMIYPGFPLGAEDAPYSWFKWILGDNEPVQFDFPTLQFAFGTEMFKYLIFNDPNWDYRDYDFSTFKEDCEYASSYLNATSTDYSRFKELGGKLILPHGWNDPALSAFTSIEHYEAVKEQDDNVDEYFRMFLLPGVLHCGGGPGPDRAEWINYIRTWVEEDQAPEKIILSKYEEGEVIMTRPVFPYPFKAEYMGQGDTKDAENFVRSKE